jgi:type I restriction enzyme S subunit
MEMIQLGLLCDFINGDRGKNYPSQNAFISEGIPFLSAKDLKGNDIKTEGLRYISESTYNKLGSGKLKDNDILFCLRGSLGKFGVNRKNIRGAIASSLVIIRPKIKIELNYLVHYLSSPSFKILVNKSDNGSSQPNLSGANVKKFKIPLPKLETQKKIVAILDEADKIRQLNKQLIAKYDVLTQSLFLEMFGDPVTNPKGWEKKELKKGAVILNGTTPSTKAPENWGNEYYWVAPAEIKTKYLLKTRKMISKIGFKSKSLKIIPENNVLLSCRAPIGKVCINKISTTTNQGFKSVVLDKSVFDEHYIYQFLMFSTDYLNSLGRGATFKEISKATVENLVIQHPPIKLQNLFAERVQVIEAQKQQAQEALQKSEDLFNSLLQKAFKGELVK